MRIMLLIILLTVTLSIANSQNVIQMGDTLYQVDCGILWLPPVQLTDTSYSAYMPKIALSGDDTVHVTWWGGGLRLPYARSSDGGYSWTIKDLISDTILYPREFARQQIATYGKDVYLFSANEGILSKQILMHKSTSGGFNWEFIKRIGTDTAIELYSANIYKDTCIVSYDPINYFDRPCFMFSTDGGATWTKRPDTLDGWTRTALTPGILHLVRNVGVNGVAEKLYMRSYDLGNTFVDAETLSTPDGKMAFEHNITSFSNNIPDSSHIMVVWRDGLACAGMVGCTIIGRESHTNGHHWLPKEILTEYPRGSSPSVALNHKGMAAVSWKDEIEQFDIKRLFVRIRKNPDSTWCLPIDVTPYSYVTGIHDIALSSNAVHVVYNNTVGNAFCVFYRRGVFLTTDVKEYNKEIPQGFSLSQNYPNPFNLTTKIRFKIQKAGFISLRVYDVFGREVATLVNEKKQPGEYEVEWDASISGVMASGVYFYRLSVYDSNKILKTEARKALLIK